MVTPKAGMNAMKSPRPVREETFGIHFIWYPSSYIIIVCASTKGWRGCNLEFRSFGPLSMELICSWPLGAWSWGSRG